MSSVTLEQLEAGREERLRASGRVSLARGPSEGKSGPRRFECVAYTGADVSRSFGPMVVSCPGIEHGKRMGMLVEHDDDRPVAVCNSFEVTPGGELRLAGYFLDDRASAGESTKMIALADQGFPLKMSIGIRFLEHRVVEEGDEVVVNGRTFQGPIVVVDRSHLFETSFIHVNPADLGTSATVMSGPKRSAREKKLARLKRRIRVAERAIRSRQERWLNDAAIKVLAGVFDEARLRPVPGKISVGKHTDRLTQAVTRWGTGRPEVVVDPRKHRCTTDVVASLLHELLHTALGQSVGHDHPDWSLYCPIIGLTPDGDHLNDLGIGIACRVIREVGEWPNA